MSKLLDMEPQHEDQEPDAPHQQQVQGQHALDAEAALHVELLTQTDAKLDRFNSRLDRFFGELSQWSQKLEQVEALARQKHAEPRQRRSPAAACLLLMVGAAAGSLYTVWRNPRMFAGGQLVNETVPLPADNAAPALKEAGSEQPVEERHQPEIPATSLEITRNEQPVEAMPQPPVLETAVQPAVQPPAPASPESPPAPQVAAAITGFGSEQAEQKDPITTAPAPQDAEMRQPAFIQSSHGRIRM